MKKNILKYINIGFGGSNTLPIFQTVRVNEKKTDCHSFFTSKFRVMSRLDSNMRRKFIHFVKH